MQVLIFALLALAVSADNYGYSSYPSYSSYSSYPSSYSSGYGTGYGTGYGSSLYGSSYGSGIGYGLGGIGQSYYSGSNLGGYASYRPSVSYQTERYSHSYPYGNAEAYKTGFYGHSTSGGPAKVVYTQDFSGNEGHSGYQPGAPVIAGVEKYVVAPVAFGSWNRAVGQEQTTGDLSGVQFAQEVAGIGAKDFESAALVDAGYGGTKSATLPKVPTGSFTESGAVGESGAKGSSTTEGGRSQISFTKDLPKTAAHSGGVARKTTGHSFDKLSPQRTVAIAPKISTGSVGVSGSEIKSGGLRTGNTAGHSQVSFVQDFSKAPGQSKQFEVKPEIGQIVPVSGRIASQVPTGSFDVTDREVKSGGLRTGNTAGHSQVSFVQDFSKVTGQAKQFEVKPEIQRIVPVSGGIASQRISGQNFGTASKTGIQGIRQTGEVSFIQGIEAVARHPGHRVAGQKQSSGYIHRSGSVYQRGTHGFSTAAGPQISFILGGTELYQRDGYRPASINNLVPVVPVARQHSPGYVHRTGSIHRTQAHSFSTGAGPQVSFTRGQTVQRQPAIVPRQSFGYQRVVGAVSKNTAQGFATASGPSRISFTQDFSKVTGHKTSAIKPEISTFDQFGVPAFPGTIVSQGYQPGKINKAPIASKSTQSPSAVVKAIKQPVVQQPAFTEFDSQSPTHASYYGSDEGHKDGDRSIFIEGPATGFADGYAVDYKHNIASIEGITGDKLSSFIVAPETTFTDDKASVLKFTSAAGGVQRSSGIFDVTGDAARSYKLSPEVHSEDKSKLYVAVPAEAYDDEKSSLFLHSSGVAPTGTFVEDRGSFYQLSPGSPDSGAATHERYGKTQEYTAVTVPFKDFHSSTYPGYSQIIGDSPRYGFSHDRSLLYSSPHSVSPFSSAYFPSDRNYSQTNKKAIA